MVQSPSSLDMGDAITRRWTRRCRIWLITATALAVSPAVNAAATGPVTRVAMMPLVARTTIVVEFDRAPVLVEEVHGEAAVVVVDAGPFTTEIAAQKLTSATGAAMVDSVSVAPFSRPDGATYARVRIAVRGEPSHRLRKAGSRVYVDFSTPAESTTVRGPDAREPAAAEPPATLPPPPAVTATVNPEAAYRALDASVRTRAEQLLTRPDVKGLIRLRNEVERRDKELGSKQPDLVGPLLSELQQMTDEARARQLERDRESFLKNPESK